MSANIKLMLRECKRKKKDSLDLSNLDLTLLPEEIYQFDFLKFIDLSNNNLCKVDDKISFLKNLEVLDLSNNLLEKLPQEIMEMKNLKEVKLSGNNFQKEQQFLNESNLELEQIKSHFKNLKKNFRSFEDEFLDDDEFIFTPKKSKANKNQVELDGFPQMENKENLGKDQDISSLKTEIGILKQKLAKIENQDKIKFKFNKELEIRGDEKLIERERISQGGFSLIMKGVFRNTEVIIKKFFDPKTSQENKDEFLNEVKMLNILRHPGIITMMGYKLPKFSNDYKIIFESIPEGNLYSFIHLKRKKFNKISFLKKTAQIFDFIHLSQICHRDIKSQNILIDQNLNPKIIDFGLARKFQDLNKGNNRYAATPAYTAPEIFLKKKLTKKVDIFAFGILMWEILSEEIPFDGFDTFLIKKKILAKELPSFKNIQSSYANIIKSCLNHEPGKRPEFHEIILSINKLID